MIVRNRFSRLLKKTILRKSTIRKSGNQFSEGITLKPTTSSSNSAAGRDGHGARDYTKGWTPSEI